MKDLQRVYETNRAHLYTSRPKDVKLGEKIKLSKEDEPLSKWLSRSRARFALLGVSEEIGVCANNGQKGTANIWPHFLKAFLNMQANSFSQAEEIALIGTYKPKTDQSLPLTKQVEEVDTALRELISEIAQYDKIPLVVGGGHNNAYPILCALSAKASQPLSVLNLDAHPDFRACEGRHSGNPFRYAKVKGALHKYALLGYHSAYIPQYVWADLQKDTNCWACSYEEIAFGEQSFKHILSEAIAFLEGEPCGLELDVDAIAGADASAGSPSGFSLEEARQYVRTSTIRLRPCYFHLCEARAIEEPSTFVGKRLAYLLHDFIYAYLLKSQSK